MDYKFIKKFKNIKQLKLIKKEYYKNGKLRKETPFVFDQIYIEVFKVIKAKIISTPIIITLNWTTRQKFTFSVDGLEDTNHLYRINAKWKSVMMGMKAMGSLPKDRKPILEWKYLVFPYNEHQVPKARQLAMDIGFDSFVPVTSERDIDFYQCDNPEIYRWPDAKA